MAYLAAHKPLSRTSHRHTHTPTHTHANKQTITHMALGSERCTWTARHVFQLEPCGGSFSLSIDLLVDFLAGRGRGDAPRRVRGLGLHSAVREQLLKREGWRRAVRCVEKLWGSVFGVGWESRFNLEGNEHKHGSVKGAEGPKIDPAAWCATQNWFTKP